MCNVQLSAATFTCKIQESVDYQ
uniref:Uncharacterized protein n=1 Tax=Anguilla anguilla TaxID=7936 RepID=A0A0E9U475_ANGAN